MPDTTVLIPTRNEGNAIGEVLDKVADLGSAYEVLVVDTDSTDGTIEECGKRNVSVVQESRRGKGIALRTGFSLVQTPYVIVIDGDGTYPIFSIPVVRKALVDGSGMVLGWRRNIEPGAMSLSHKIGNRIITLVASLVCIHMFRDVLTGLKGFRKSELDRFDLRAKGFDIEVDLISNAIDAGCKILEVPITYGRRVDGTRSKLGWTSAFSIMLNLFSIRRGGE